MKKVARFVKKMLKFVEGAPRSDGGWRATLVLGQKRGVGGGGGVGAIVASQQWGRPQPLRTALHTISKNISLQNSLS